MSGTGLLSFVPATLVLVSFVEISCESVFLYTFVTTVIQTWTLTVAIASILYCTHEPLFISNSQLRVVCERSVSSEGRSKLVASRTADNGWTTKPEEWWRER